MGIGSVAQFVGRRKLRAGMDGRRAGASAAARSGRGARRGRAARSGSPAPSIATRVRAGSRPNRDGTFKHWENSRTVVKTSCLLHRPVRPAATLVTKACVCNYSLREPFSCCRFRSRTPGPPPFSSMNSTPADSNARRIAKSLALSVPSGSPLAPRDEWWQRLVPTQRQDSPRSNE
jgi:hypothetical protein